MSRLFLKQSAVSITSRMVTALSALVASMIIARTLGPYGSGIYTSVFAVVTIVIALADLGVRQALTTLTGRQELPDHRLVAIMNSLVALNGPVAMALVAAALIFSGGYRYGAGIVLLALLTIPPNLYCTYAKGIFLGKGWVTTVNGLEFARSLSLPAALILALGICSWGPYGLVGAYVVSALAAAILAFVGIQRIARAGFDWHWPSLRMVGTRGFQYALAMFFISINYRIDVVMMERMRIPTAEIGYYGVGAAIAEAIWQVPNALGMILMSRNSRSRTDQEAVDRTLRLLRMSLPVVGVITAVAIFATPAFIRVMYGDAFLPAVEATWWILPGVFVGVVFKILNSDLAARGKPLAALGIYAAVVPLNITVLLVLIPRYGFVGAAAATSLCYSIGAIALLLRYSSMEGVPLRDALIPRRTDWQTKRKVDLPSPPQ